MALFVKIREPICKKIRYVLLKNITGYNSCPIVLLKNLLGDGMEI